MKNSVTTWIEKGELTDVLFQQDNDMVTLYWGDSLEIYMPIKDLKYLFTRIEEFLKEKENVVSKG